MPTPLTLRSGRELTRRRARSGLTIATIAAAVTGLWLFAVPLLIDDAMNDRIERDLLWDVRLSPNPVELSDDDVAAIREVSGVVGVEARLSTGTRFQADGRDQRAWLIGVDDFEDQEVNAVRLSDGRAPGPGEVITDSQNSRTGRYGGEVGDRLRLGGFPVTVSGVGASLEFSATVDDADPVFYVPLDDLQAAAGGAAINWIDLRVEDHEPAAVAATAEAVRRVLATADPAITYWDVLQVREPGDWPEKDSFDNVIRLTYIVAVLGLLSALLMVSTTMNTIVREQQREIGVLKALGGTRRAIVRSYVLTTGLLGALGTTVGVVTGVVLSNLLVGFAGRQFSGVEPALGAPPVVLGLSLLVGFGGTILAALPAVRRATAIPVHEALVDHGLTASFGHSRLDRALARPSRLPRALRLGARNAVRHKGRSLVTAAQIGLAVGTFLGFLALGITVMAVTAESFDAEGGDIWVRGPADVAPLLEAVPGVAEVVPVYFGDVGVDGETYVLQGQPPNAATLHDDLDGRWFTAQEEADRAAVTVLGPAVARATGAGVGDVVGFETLRGRRDLEVVGVEDIMVEDGRVIWTPLATAIEMGGGGAPGHYFVLTAESDETSIDGVAAGIRRALDSRGLDAGIETRYIERRAELSQNRTIIAILMIVGLPVIAIGMIGLANTISTNLLERTREIGILRAIGARARHIRAIVRAEALLIALAGWLLALPIGYLVGLVLVRLIGDGFGVDFEARFPLWPLPVALILTLVVTRLAISAPVRRAVRLPPGLAVRYE